MEAGDVTRHENEPDDPPATRAIVAPIPFQPVTSVSNEGLGSRLAGQPPAAYTVMMRLSGVGSARPSASVAVNVTV